MRGSGKRRERVTFQEPKDHQETGKELRTLFVDVFTRWAEVQSQEGSELQEQRRVTGENTIRITVLSDPETRKIGQGWRLAWNCLAWNVSSAIPTEDKAEIVVRAMQVKGAV